MNELKIKNTKSILIGKASTGKTTILGRIRDGFFVEGSIATIGSSFTTVNNEGITLDIWDTAGQERYINVMAPMYFRDAKIIIFVFDVENEPSIFAIKNYITELIKLKNFKIILIGNKTDILEDSEKDLTLDILKEMVYNVFDKIPINGNLVSLKKQIYGLYFISAKTGENFNDFWSDMGKCSKLFTPEFENTVILLPEKEDIVDENCYC